MISLVLHDPSMGLQHFAARDVAALLAQSPRGCMSYRLVAGELHVAGATVVEACLGAELRVHEPTVLDFAVAKAERKAAARASLAGVDWSRVLAGKHPRWDLGVRRWSLARPGHVDALMSDEGFRRTGRVDEAGILVRCWGSVPVVADGKHRLLAAWAFGLASVWGRVWTPGGVVYAGPLWLR
jgi:hypothetical protein